jgi:transcriptional regulator with XRE-family HTH domain
MNLETIRRGGKTFVLVEQGDYERLTGAAGKLPALPLPDAEGNVDAVEYARVSIARDIISRRLAAGMTQADLAWAAGVRVETLNRLENARHTADVATLTKIDAALAAPKRPKRPSTLTGSRGKLPSSKQFDFVSRSAGGEYTRVQSKSGENRPPSSGSAGGSFSKRTARPTVKKTQKK